MIKKTSNSGRAAVLLLATAAVLSCGSDVNTDFPSPSEPIEATLYDLVAGPIDRASAVNVVSGRGVGFPSAVRIDISQQWDIAFGVVDGETAWLPRGFFDGLEAESGILEVPREFSEITEAPDNKDLYETRNPVPLSEGTTYIIRSRNDPTLSLPCRIYAKVRVESVQQDPDRVDFLILWNPNCDNRNLTLGQES